MLMRPICGLFALLVVGCSASTPGTASSSPLATVTPTTAAAASPSQTAVGPSASASADATAGASPPSVGSGPPAGQLAAEGGDAVTGQLGTYVWHDEGSDSPWLPGAPIALGRGEPLSITFRPSVVVASWQARTVPAGADGPTGATAVADGTGTPQFGAPAPGAWTLEVHVVFADGAGDASYFWRLDVT
jgi:hypothetical protein